MMRPILIISLRRFRFWNSLSISNQPAAIFYRVLAQRRLKWGLCQPLIRYRSADQACQYRRSGRGKGANAGWVVRYDGDTAIDGVPGTAARIDLQFMDVVGAATGKLLPTGNLRDQFDDIEVTCMDVAMPTVTRAPMPLVFPDMSLFKSLKPKKISWLRWKRSGSPLVRRWAWEMCANLSRQNLRCLHRQRRVARLRALFYAMASTSDNGGNWRAMSGVMRHDPWQYCRWVC